MVMPCCGTCWKCALWNLLTFHILGHLGKLFTGMCFTEGIPLQNHLSRAPGEVAGNGLLLAVCTAESCQTSSPEPNGKPLLSVVSFPVSFIDKTYSHWQRKKIDKMSRSFLFFFLLSRQRKMTLELRDNMLITGTVHHLTTEFPYALFYRHLSFRTSSGQLYHCT